MRSAGVLLLLACFLAAAPSQAADDLGSLVADLGSTDWKVRSAAYRELVSKHDPAALPHLRRALPGFAWGGQYYGVLVLDRYPARQARRTWRALLEAESPWLRVAAATALLRAGDESGVAAGSTALQAEGVSPGVRAYMIGRLGWQPRAEFVAALRALLQTDQDRNVVVRVFVLLHRLQDRGAAPDAQRLLADARPGVRALAAAFLYDIGQTQRAKQLAAALRAGVGESEFPVLATMLSPTRHVADEVLEAVAARLADEKDPKLLARMMDLLGAHQFREARPALHALLAHPKESVARKAFDVLVTMSGPLREDTLRPLLRGDDVGRRLWAAEALRQRDDTSGIAVVIYALQAGTVPQRKDAARILGSYTMDLAVEPLLDALGDAHPEVRAAALAQLQRLFTRLFPYRWVRIASTGYEPQADEEQRRAGIATLRAWWKHNRSADW